MDKDATFQDILLELMVANETLEKIEKNSSSLLPLLIDSISIPQDELKESAEISQLPLSDCCSQILASAQNMADSLEYIARPNATADKVDKILDQATACVVGLNYLARYAQDSNTLLVDIINELL